MSDSGMSTHPCNKSDHHHKVKDLTRQLSEAREEIARLRKENEALVKAVHAACNMLEK